MNAPAVLSVGVVDAAGIAGSAGVCVPWTQLGIAAPGNGRTLRAVFGRADDTFRRLDGMSRALVLATAAAGLDERLPAHERAGAALVVETSVGCLEADLQFAASMSSGMCDGPVFPYTLPSTCLGEVALRHGLRGPSVCLSVAPEAGGAALAEAHRLLAGGEARYVVAAAVDVFVPEVRAIAVLLTHATPGVATAAPWPGVDREAFARLASAAPRA